MRSPAILQSRHLKTKNDIFLLCDLTDVFGFFREALTAGRLLEMPEFVVFGTTPVLLGVTRAVNLNLGIHTLKTATGEADTGCP